jgi:Transcription factor Tfb4
MASELLIIVVDCCTDSWSPLDAAKSKALEEAEAAAAVEGQETAAPPAPTPTRASFPDFITHLNLFLASFCALNRRNALAVLGFSETNGGGYIWPRPGDAHHPSIAASSPHTDMLRPAAVGRACEDRLARLRYGDSTIDELMGGGEEEGEGGEGIDEDGKALEKQKKEEELKAGSGIARLGISKRHNSLAACLSLALCYNQTQKRIHTSKGGLAASAGGATGGGGDSGPLRTRIIVFSAGPDRAVHYASTINAIFSAQRFGIPIDAVVLGDSPSSVLQQACDLTKGIYSHPSLETHNNNLLYQFLVNTHLPDAATREFLLPPPAHSVDLRASCFCHRKHVSLSYVCSVCLSIWCNPKAICPVCGADTRPKEVKKRLMMAAATAAGGAGAASSASSSAGSAGGAGGGK